MPSASLSPGQLAGAALRPLPAQQAERVVEALFPGRACVLFASARGALAAAIEAVAADGEVAIPAFTCAAVPNAVVSAGCRPVYVDVGASGLAPPEAYPPGIPAVVQDTFGLVAPVPATRPFVRDAAHRVPRLEDGLDGAAATVFSFEHSKSLSAGRGGLLLTADAQLATQLRAIRDGRRPGGRWRSLAVTAACWAMGRLDFAGRHGGAELFRKAAWHLDASRLLGQSGEELAGRGVDPRLLGPLDGSAARLLVLQLARAPAVSAHRARLARVYDRCFGVAREAQPLVRYPLLADDVGRFEERLARAGWDVRGRWFTGPVHPAACDLAALGYRPGAAPCAEALARRVVNLPTHPLVSEDQAAAIAAVAARLGVEPLAS